MNIDGVRVLTQEAIIKPPDFVWIIAGLLVGCMILFTIWTILLDSDWTLIVLIISGIVAFSWVFVAGVCGVSNKPSGRNTYKCFFEEDVSIIEVYDKYEIVGRDGEIWILEDK